jgi:eukaryotic-like serine/threonine-protein kinase
LGLVHRDIKPANLWLEAPNGRVKVLDFGLAKPVGTDAELTKSGAVVGTPAYMSPEQARGAKVDHRTDLFSLGAVLYRLCTGKTPFAGPNVMAVLMALGSDDPTPVRELNPAVPEALARLIHQLLAKKPEQRPQTAIEVAKRLRAILNQLLAPGPTAPVSSGSAPTVSGADLSSSQPVVVNPIPNQPPIVVPMHVSAAPEDVFANLDRDDDATAGEARATEPTPAAPKPERKKGGKGLLIAVGGVVLLAAVAVAVVVSQADKKGTPNAEKPPENPTAVAGPPKAGGKPAPSVAPVWKPVGSDPVDVLALDPRGAELAGTGTWAHTADGWTLPIVPGGYPTVSLPLRAVGSYSLTVAARLDAGSDFLGIALPVGDRSAVFALNAFNGTARGFALIGGRNFHLPDPNPTRTEKPAAAIGQTFRIELTVALTGDRAELTAVVDDAEPIRWSGPVADLSLHETWKVLPGRLGLVSYGSRWTVSALKFRRTGGEAAVLEWGSIGSDPDRTAAEWVIAQGGAVRVNGEERDRKTVAELPKERFTLTWVQLSYTPVSDAGLAQFKDLKGLTHLSLGYTPVSDAGLTHLADLRSLTWLHLGATQVSGTGLVHLKELKDLQKLFLDLTKASDVGLEQLKELKKLSVLGLAGTQVTDAGLAHLRSFKGLSVLGLGDTSVSDAGLEHLRELKSLTILYLDGTSVSDAGLTQLKELKSLTILYLRKTKVTAKGLEAIHAALPACKIDHDGGTIEPKK